MIVSKIDETKDLKNCMLLCKNLRNLIFKTPEIMRKLHIKMSFDGMLSNAAQHFINSKGKYFKNFTLISYRNSKFEIKSILSAMKNLESLKFMLKLYHWCQCGNCCFCEVPTKTDQNLLFEMPKLRILKINLNALNLLNETVKNVNNLNKLKVHCIFYYSKHDLNHAENLTKFLNQQNNLQELRIKTTHDCEYSTEWPLKFENLNIQPDFKFKLEKFTYYTGVDDSLNFENFILSQVQFIKELKLRFDPGDNFLEFMFDNFVNLEKLNLKYFDEYLSFSNNLNDKILPSLKFLKTDEIFINLKLFVEKFPNLEELICDKFHPIKGVFENIVTLHLEHLACHELKALKLPNLKILTIGNLQIKYEKSCKIFLKNIPKIEKIFIKANQHFKIDSLVILKKLKKCKNLKCFLFSHEMQNNKLLKQSFNIDISKKIVKYSKNLNNDCKKLLNVYFACYTFEEKI